MQVFDISLALVNLLLGEDVRLFALPSLVEKFFFTLSTFEIGISIIHMTPIKKICKVVTINYKIN